MQVYHIEHPSLAFLAVCPVNVEKGMFEIRVARRDGRVDANTVEISLDLGWSVRDKLLVSSSLGKLVAVVGSSILMFDL